MHALSQGSRGLLARVVAVKCDDPDCRLYAGSADSASAWENWENDCRAVIAQTEFCADVSWHKDDVLQTT